MEPLKAEAQGDASLGVQIPPQKVLGRLGLSHPVYSTTPRTLKSPSLSPSDAEIL